MKKEVSLRTTLIMLALSLAMTGYGVLFNDEVKIVLKKATAICMQCIGLG